MRRGFKGIWIPAEIWLSPKLTMTEKVLLAEIDSFDRGDGCFASNGYFARFLGVSARTISTGLTNLKEQGYIYVEHFDGRKRVLRVTPDSQKRLRSHANSARQKRKYGEAPSMDVDEYMYNGVDPEFTPNGVPEPKRRRNLPALDEIPADILAEAETRVMGRTPHPTHGTLAWKDMVRTEAAALMEEAR